MADNLLATQLRKGMIVKIDNNLYRIFDRQHVTPGNLRGFVRVKMRNIKNGSMAEEKFRSEDIVERVSLEQKDMQYLYNDGDGYHFMDTATYEQVQLRAELAGRFGRLPEAGDEHPGRVLRREPDRHRAAADRGPEGGRRRCPAIKGATATNQIKPATLETGVVVQVPPFIGEGDVIRVNTETGEYQTRA